MKSLMVRAAALLAYLAALLIWWFSYSSVPRWIVLAALVAGIFALTNWLTRSAWTRLTIASLVLLAASLCLDIYSSAALAAEGQYAASDIGLGLVRLLAFIAAFVGIAMYPRVDFQTDKPLWPTNWWSPHPGRRGRMILIGVLVVGLVYLTIVVVMTVGHEKSPQAPRQAADTSFDVIRGELISANNRLVGTCVHLSGKTLDAPVAEEQDCGLPTANYRIVQVVRTPSQCVKDADQRYHSISRSDEYTYCLDYNWSIHYCMKMPAKETWYATRVNCDIKTEYPMEQPQFVVLDTTDLSQCPNGGWAHPVRKFTVCTLTKR